MNCQQFTSHIVEAARGRMMDAAARDAATRHAAACADCAARLAQEQNLTGALRTVAAEMKDLSASARIEAKLLAAFQESLAGAQSSATTATAAATATTASAVTTATGATALTTVRASLPAALRASKAMSGGAVVRSRPWRAAFAATAAIAATLALVAFVALYERFAQNAPPAVATTNGATTTNGAAQDNRETSPVAPQVAVQSTLPPGDDPAEQPRRNTLRTPGRVDAQRASLTAEAQRTSPKLARAATPRMIMSRQVIDGGNAIFASGEVESAANHAGGAAKPNETETVTEFIPLVGGAPGATPLESGQLVRVQLPRAALAPLGLPLNAERGNEPVQADVLLGNDGLARAIRFVR